MHELSYSSHVYKPCSSHMPQVFHHKISHKEEVISED